jgi:hypothetical protein
MTTPDYLHVVAICGHTGVSRVPEIPCQVLYPLLLDPYFAGSKVLRSCMRIQTSIIHVHQGILVG